MQKLVFDEERINSFSYEEFKFLCLNSFDKILINEKKLTKETILKIIRNLKDLSDRY
jgi:hypothetical protein